MRIDEDNWFEHAPKWLQVLFIGTLIWFAIAIGALSYVAFVWVMS